MEKFSFSAPEAKRSIEKATAELWKTIIEGVFFFGLIYDKGASGAKKAKGKR